MLQSHDGQQLIGILDELTEHKEDSQQRTWAVHEDEGIIHKLLKNLLGILVSHAFLLPHVFTVSIDLTLKLAWINDCLGRRLLKKILSSQIGIEPTTSHRLSLVPQGCSNH